MSVIKKCSKCGTWWIGEQGFHRHSQIKDGFRSRCLVCTAADNATRLVAAPIITAERLRELLIYNPDIGDFRDRNTGKLVGAPGGNGYWLLFLDGRSYLAHRLAWLYQKGSWPPRGLDHRDLDKSNNRWTNLRLATHGQNQANTRARANGQIGVKGVRQIPSGKFRACIKSNGKERHLGVFVTVEAAAAAYTAAAREAWGEYARAE